MAWSWRYLDDKGKPVNEESTTFPSQSDAESWLGEYWRDLLDEGVATVELREDDRTEYAMPLTPMT